MSHQAPTTTVHSFTDLWEYQCCGEPVAVGDVLRLEHIPYDDGLGALAGVHEVDWYVGHHTVGEQPGHAADLVRVLDLWEVRVTLDVHRRPGHVAPRAGSARLTRVDRMRPWGPAWAEDRPAPAGSHDPAEPAGWLMRLDPLPPR